MQIKGENYNVWCEANTTIVNFTGSLRLSGMEEYASILKLMNSLADSNPASIILNIQHLEFLNSSGISMLSKFVIDMRKRQNIQISILGSILIPWQGKSLKNLQRLMPSLILELH